MSTLRPICHFLLIIVGVIMLAACTTPQPQQPYIAPTKGTESSDANSHIKFFKPELSVAYRDTVKAMAAFCQSMQSKNPSCLRDAALVGFDPMQLAKDGCQPVADLNDFILCLMEGNLAISMRELLPEDVAPAMSAADWRDLDRYIDKLDSAFAVAMAGTCHRSTETETNRCIEQIFLTKLPLPSDAAPVCGATVEKSRFTQCFGEAYLLKLLREGADRIAAKSA